MLPLDALCFLKSIKPWTTSLSIQGIVPGMIQQIRLTSQQRVADASAASDKLRASNEVKYTQGELNAINSVLQVSLSTLLKLRRTGQSGVDIDSRSTHAYI